MRTQINTLDDTSHRMSTTLMMVVLGLMLLGCSGDGEEELLSDKPVDELYAIALNLMQQQDYRAASRGFEEVERQHPYSQLATKAQLMSAYALYQAMAYDEAITALDDFIQLHPGHADTPYAHYLRALCFYERIADVRRDQSAAKSALQELQSIVVRFPNTDYARDAGLKIALVNDHLAGSEMEIGRNYMKQNLYTAAIGRFRRVVEKYQTTSHVPEALHRLVECYLAVGIKDEARVTAAVLGHNFPGSEWYNDTYKLMTTNGVSLEEDPDDLTSWIGSVWGRVF